MSEFGSETINEAYLEPLTSESQINYNYVYALYNFMATLEGQISVLRGEELELVDDSNSYWWACRCISTGEVGYIPAENIETPEERLARLNRNRNVENAVLKPQDHLIATKSKKPRPKLNFALTITEIYPNREEEVVEIASDLEDNPTAPQSEDASDVKPGTEQSVSFFKSFFKSKKPKDSYLPSKQKSIVELEDELQDSTVKRTSNTPINVLRIYPGNISISTSFKSVSFDQNTTVLQMMLHALKKFRVQNQNPNDYYVTIMELDGNNANRETKLNPDDDINVVLDSFGVFSFISNSQNSKRKGSLSQIRQPDDVIKILMHKKDANENAVAPSFRIVKDGSGKGEKILIHKEMTIAEVVVNVRKYYRIQATEKVKLYSKSTNTLISEKSDAMTVFQQLAKNEKIVTLVLVVEDGTTPKRTRPATAFIEKTQSSPRQKNNLMPTNSSSSPKVDFANMINSLDQSIIQTTQKSTVPLSQRIGEFERDLEKMVSMSINMSATRCRSSRLSILYNAGNPEQIDAREVFQRMKFTKSKLMQIRTSMNQLLVDVLSKNSIPVN